MNVRCTCGASVVWAVSARTNAPMPFDAVPVEGAEWVLAGGVARHSPPPPPGQLSLLVVDTRPRYRSHWKTCPDAPHHREGSPSGDTATVGDT